MTCSFVIAASQTCLKQECNSYTHHAPFCLYIPQHILSDTSDKKKKYGEEIQEKESEKKDYSTSPMIFAASLYVSSSRSHFSRSALIPSSSYSSSLNSSSL